MATPVVSDKSWNVIVGGGGVNLYFYRLGTATNVFSMEVNKKGAFLKISFISVLKT